MGCRCRLERNSQVRPDVFAPFVKEVHISDDNVHDTLVGGGARACQNPSTEKLAVRGSGGLPDAGRKVEQGADDEGWASAEDLAAGDDEEVAVSESDDGHAGLEDARVSECSGERESLSGSLESGTHQQGNIGQRDRPLVHKDRGQRGNGQCRDDADDDEDALVDVHQSLPQRAPVLQASLVSMLLSRHVVEVR